MSLFPEKLSAPRNQSKRKKKSRAGKKIGQDILVCCEKNNWTQKQFAATAGVSQTLVCLLINGKHMGSFKDKETLEKIQNTIFSSNFLEPFSLLKDYDSQIRETGLWTIIWRYIVSLFSKSALGGAHDKDQDG